MNKIRELRKEKELTLKELSNDLKQNGILEIAPDTLGKYERGDREPKLETWQALAKYFGVSVPYLQGISLDRDWQDLKLFSDFTEKTLSAFANSIQSKDNLKKMQKYNFSPRDVTLVKQGLLLSVEIVNNLGENFALLMGSYNDSKEIADIILNALQGVKIEINDEDRKILENNDN